MNEFLWMLLGVMTTVFIGLAVPYARRFLSVAGENMDSQNPEKQPAPSPLNQKPSAGQAETEIVASQAEGRLRREKASAPQELTAPPEPSLIQETAKDGQVVGSDHSAPMQAQSAPSAAASPPLNLTPEEPTSASSPPLVALPPEAVDPPTQTPAEAPQNTITPTKSMGSQPPDIKAEDIIEGDSVSELESASDPVAVEVPAKDSASDRPPPVDTEPDDTCDAKPSPMETAAAHYLSEWRQFESDGYLEDRQRYQAAQISFQKWVAYMTVLSAGWDDFLLAYREILENPRYGIEKDKQVIVMSLPKRNSIDLPAAAARALATTTPNKNDLMKTERLTVRLARELDYSLDDSRFTANQRPILKGALEGILRAYRMLTLLANGRLHKLQAKALEDFPQLLIPLTDMDHPGIVQQLFGEVPEDAVKNLHEALSTTLRANNQRVETAEKLAEGLRKTYFNFLKTTLLNALKTLKTERRQFSIVLADTAGEDNTALTQWSQIFRDLINWFEAFLEPLHIEAIRSKRGAVFNPTVHMTTTEGEPDLELPDGTIRSIENDGYQFDDTNTREVIMPIEVTVTDNRGVSS